MKKFNSKIKVISLGGSLVNPGQINIDFLKEFRELIFNLTDQFRFLIVVGGGKIARNYQNVLKTFGIKKQNLLDEVGIFATYLNAKLVQLILLPRTSEKILVKLRQKIDFDKKPILIGAGTKPGWSTDYDSFYWARKLNVSTVINATNIDFVYDRPPELEGAQVLKKLSWEQYFKIIGPQWRPGANFPIDPVAGRFAQKNKMQTFILKGSNLFELKKAILGQDFTGSVIF